MMKIPDFIHCAETESKTNEKGAAKSSFRGREETREVDGDRLALLLEAQPREEGTLAKSWLSSEGLGVLLLPMIEG